MQDTFQKILQSFLTANSYVYQTEQFMNERANLACCITFKTLRAGVRIYCTWITA